MSILFWVHKILLYANARGMKNLIFVLASTFACLCGLGVKATKFSAADEVPAAQPFYFEQHIWGRFTGTDDTLEAEDEDNKVRLYNLDLGEDDAELEGFGFVQVIRGGEHDKLYDFKFGKHHKPHYHEHHVLEDDDDGIIIDDANEDNSAEPETDTLSKNIAGKRTKNEPKTNIHNAKNGQNAGAVDDFAKNSTAAPKNTVNNSQNKRLNKKNVTEPTVPNIERQVIRENDNTNKSVSANPDNNISGNNSFKKPNNKANTNNNKINVENNSANNRTITKPNTDKIAYLDNKTDSKIQPKQTLQKINSQLSNIAPQNTAQDKENNNAKSPEKVTNLAGLVLFKDIPVLLGAATVVCQNSAQKTNFVATGNTKNNSEGSTPLLAIVIDDFGGYERTGVETLMHCDVPITCAIIPFVDNSEADYEAAVENDKEVILHMPMQAHVNLPEEWYGTVYIKNTDSPADALEKLKNCLATMPKAKGFNIHIGSGACQNLELMNAMYKYAAENNLFFLDSRTILADKCEEAAKAQNMVYLGRDVFLEPNKNRSYEGVLTRLAEGMQVAKNKGVAVVIGHVGAEGGENTAKCIADHAQKLAEQYGVKIVPLSNVYSHLEKTQTKNN